MQHQEQKNLFHLHNELTDRKIEMSITQAISPLTEQISNLKHEIQQFKNEVRHEFQLVRTELKHEFHQELHQELGKLKEDMSAIKERLGMRNQVQGEIRARFFDYSFKAGWLIGVAALSAVISYFMSCLHAFIL